MDQEEDYFGNVTAPEGPEEGDAANDLTFGDTSDIKAGDPESDVVWKANHEALAREIEMEKEALLKRQESSSLSHVVPQPNLRPHQTALHPSQVHLQQQQAMLHAQHLQQARLQQAPEMQPLHPAYMNHLQYAHQHALMQQQQVVAEQQRRLYLAQQYAQQQQHQRMMLAMNEHNQRNQQAGTVFSQTENQRQLDEDARGHQRQGLSGVPGEPMTLEELERRMGARPGTKTDDAPAPALSRMEEIERQMAAAGLGPLAAGRRPDRDAHDGCLKPSSKTGSDQATTAPSEQATAEAEKSTRLESMTDRDLEVVLRMHLRQLENTVPYKDDFYAYALREKDAKGNPDAFDALASKLAGVDDSFLRRTNGPKSGPRGSRPRSKATQGHNDSAGSVNLGSTHTPGHISTLANALGTLQVWNPKAPRKLVDFGIKNPSKGSGSQASYSSGDPDGAIPVPLKDAKGGPRTLLRDDKHIAIRAAVEEGYDAVAAIHDVVRRKSTVPLDPLVLTLYELLRLPPAGEETLYSSEDYTARDSFFISMCSFKKGKLFVARALVLLKPVQKGQIMSCLMRHLSTLLNSDKALQGELDLCENFWNAVCETIGNSHMEPLKIVAMLRSFDDTHKGDPNGVTSVLGSLRGSRLLYTSLERVFGDINCGMLSASDSYVTTTIDSLFDALLIALSDVFECAESSAGVWQVLALLDALANPEQQIRLRGLLKQLLEEGRAPPPPP
jgi:hypothetical protein